MAAAQSHVSTGRAALDQPTVETNDVGPKMLALLHKEVTQITSTGVSFFFRLLCGTDHKLPSRDYF